MGGHFALVALEVPRGVHEFGDSWPGVCGDMPVSIFGTPWRRYHELDGILHIANSCPGCCAWRQELPGSSKMQSQGGAP